MAAPIKKRQRPKKTEPSQKTRTAARRNQNPKSLKARNPKTENSWRLANLIKQKGRKQAHCSMLACGLIFALLACALCRRRLCFHAPTHRKYHLSFGHIRVHHHM